MNYKNKPVDLLLDVYQPANDTISCQSLILFAMEVLFLGGPKNGHDVVPLAELYAKMGFVTASIDYRVGMRNLIFRNKKRHTTEAVIRATQDAKEAIRFFKHTVVTLDNPYGIDTTNIYLVGSSAGGFIALHLIYLDKLEEIPSKARIDKASLHGSLDGQTNYPNHNSDVKAIINLSGAIGNVNWMENNHIPILSIHEKADELGIINCLKILKGYGHIPYAHDEKAFETTTFHITHFINSILKNELENLCILDSSLNSNSKVGLSR